MVRLKPQFAHHKLKSDDNVTKMKTSWRWWSAVGGLLIMVLWVRYSVIKFEEDTRRSLEEMRRGPFGAFVPSFSNPPTPTPVPEIHLDLKDLTVSSDSDNSDEKQVLIQIEKALTSNTYFPLMEVRWNRLAPGRLSEPRDLIYGRDALQLEYRIGNQPVLRCSKVKAMDMMGISHAPTTDIARDMGTISRRK
jgi:hypothetical protein